MIAVQMEQNQQTILAPAKLKDVSQAWNTIYNVMQLNKIAYDPEDAVRIIRHPLITILESLNSDYELVMDYLTRNEVLTFLAQKSAEPANEHVILAFFAYFIDALPEAGLVNADCIDAVTLLLHKAVSTRQIVEGLLVRMSKSESVCRAYLCNAVVRGSLEPILDNGDVSLLFIAGQCMDDFEFAELAVYCKALAVQIVNAVMMDEREAIVRIDRVVEKVCWEQFRVALVEAVRLYCVPILADSDYQFLLKLLQIVTQPELVVPVASRLLSITIGTANFDIIKEIADKAPGLVFTHAPDNLTDFPIEKSELMAVLDKHADGQELYNGYLKSLTKQSIEECPSLVSEIKKQACQHRIHPNTSLEHVLLQARPIPVCMPASARICAYYLAFLQTSLIHQ